MALRSATLSLMPFVLAALAACQSGPMPPPAGSTEAIAARAIPGDLPPRPLWLLGEQHDAPAHQTLQNDLVRVLATQGRLAAVVIEMVEAGRSTLGLPPDAEEARVRAALDWEEESNRSGWPWSRYGPTVMSAVRAGAPVLGGNLPRNAQRSAMTDTTLDGSLDPDSLERQRSLVREGHCGLLPEAQIAPMTRIQLARDRSLAQVASSAIKPGQTVLMVAGNEHVRRDLGVPRHLPPNLAIWVLQARSESPTAATSEAAGTPSTVADRIWMTPPIPARDYCAELRRQMGR